MFFQTLVRLRTLANKYQGRSFTASEFTKLIRRQFPAADFSFRTHRDSAVDPDMVIVSGIYDCYNDDNDMPYVEITLSYHPDQQTYLSNSLNWEQISFDVAECICHELIHRQQHKQKQQLNKYISNHENECIRDEQEYLGDEAELDAYGFSIAAEAVFFNKLYIECNMYQLYQKTFDNDHSVIVKLEQHINKYLKQLEPQDEQASGRSSI